MSVPAPPTALANQVTAIHANTLFAYQPTAFQSISLAKDSKWESLPNGVSVNGSQAVVAQSGGKDGLFIIGGRANDSAQSFPGLQKFDFDSKAWQTLTLAGGPSVVQNRVQHGAVFLESSKSLLVFGGSQDNSYRATADTYTIGIDEPYNMNSHGPGAPPVQNPILLPYNASHALMAGGGASQEQIWTFSEASGWVMMTTTVPGGVADASKVQGAITTDDSGNKQLSLFDLSQSPNKVTTISLSNKFHKRGPPAIVERDGTDAPTAPRTGFSLAQADDLIVLSGGTSDEKAGSLAVFNSGKWQDPSSVFGSQQQQPVAGSQPVPGAQPAAGSQPGASPSVARNGFSAAQSSAPADQSPAASASSGAPASSAAPASSVPASASQAAPSGASAAGSSSVASGVSSGAASATNSAASSVTASGSAVGSAAATSGGVSAAKTSGGASSTAAGAASASSGAPPAGGAGSDSTTVILAAVLGSFFGIAAIFLIALLLVRYRRNKAREERMRQEALDEKRAESPASTIGSINHGRNRSPFENGQTPQISRPTLEPQTQAEDLAPPRKLGQDDEWGRYFNNNNTVENLYPGSHEQSHLAEAALGGAAVGAGFAAAGARNTQYTVGSEYTIDSPSSSSTPHESAIVPPLHLRASSHGQFEHARTISDVSSNNRASYMNSGFAPMNWDPTSSFDGSSGRPASSIYPVDRASSIYPTNPLSPNTMSNFPPVPMRPTTSGNDKGMRSIISTDFGSGTPAAQNGNMAFTESAARRAHPGSEPRSAGSGTGHTQKDLSWLQIGSAN